LTFGKGMNPIEKKEGESKVGKLPRGGKAEWAFVPGPKRTASTGGQKGKRKNARFHTKENRLWNAQQVKKGDIWLVGCSGTRRDKEVTQWLVGKTEKRARIQGNRG